MDYEQKYKEALERARKIENGEPIDVPDGTHIPVAIFPELKESEDERIRKALIELVRMVDKNPIHQIFGYGDIKYSDMIAWLEKQYADPIKEYWRGYNEGKQYVLDKYAELEKQGEQKEINLVEILKYYPKETKLYSPLYGKLWLAEVDEKNGIITCYKHHLEEGCTRAVLEQEDTVSFYSNGTTGLPDFNVSKDCMLFLYDIEKQGEQKASYTTIVKTGDGGINAFVIRELSVNGEQKPIDKIKPKFKVGDILVSEEEDRRHIYKVNAITNYDTYLLLDLEYGYTRNESVYTSDLAMYLWTIQDAKDGDVLFMDNGSANCIFIYKSSNNGIINKYASYNKFGFESEHYLVLNDGYVIPATKEQCDTLMKAMANAGYVWDKENKELKKKL